MRTSAMYLVASTTFLLCAGVDECCGVGGPELVAVSADDECWYGRCAFAVGTEVVTELYGDLNLVSATLADPALADFSIVGNQIVWRPRAAGDGGLTLELSDGTLVDQWLETAEIATTTVMPDRGLAALRNVYPPGRKQMFAGSTLRVTAEHRDANGGRLLGHGREAWSVNGGTLVEAALLDGYDSALVRDLVAGQGPLVSVTATSGGTPYELEVVPPGSTRMLELELEKGPLRSGELVTSMSESITAPLNAYSADGRYIAGTPPGIQPQISVGDTRIIEVTAIDRRRLQFKPQSAGRTRLTVSFDGATAQFDVVVR